MILRMFALLLLVWPAIAQHRVDMRNTYHRLICVVPMTGSGSEADPRRPEYAPIPGQETASGIVAYGYQMSDDGQYALVEFVARDRAAFQQLLQDRRPQIRIFERGRHKREDVLLELRKFRRDFDLRHIEVAVP